MKKLSVASFALLAGIGSASAADMPVKAPIAVPFSWTGFYIGANVGYSWGRARDDFDATSSVRTRVFRTAGPDLISDVTVPGPSFALGGGTDVTGWIAGGQIGYNWQANRFVFGVELDLQASGQDGDSTFCSTAACGVGSLRVIASHEMNWFGTARLRAGFLLTDTILLYATGGLAVADLDSTYTATLLGVGTGSASTSDTRVGWVIGGGAEAALSRNWSIKAEYLYLDFGDVNSAAGSATSSVNLLNTPLQGQNTVIDTTVNASARTRWTDNILRVGLNYRFTP
jgi:outer membrane immunogenic protein